MIPGAIADPKCSLELARRGAIKHPPGWPKLVVCIPLGAKDEEQIFHHPEAGACGMEGCPCPWHGKNLARTVRNQGLVPAEWAMNHMQLVIPLNVTVGYLAVKGKLAGVARDELTKRALELHPEYVFYWDDDVILPSHALYQLHNAMERDPSIGLLTGVVCTREDPTEPMVYREHGHGAWWDFSIRPEDPPEDIFSAGGGCLMVRAEALRRMTPPYWQDTLGSRENPDKPGTSLWGHDIYFVEKVRRQSGMRTCVKGSVLCGHWDIERQKLYELPKDSPPYQRTPPQLKPTFSIEESPRLSPEFVHLQLLESDSSRRLFVVPKEVQAREEIEVVLGGFFSRVQVVSVDSRWIGIGEELKDGWNHPLTGDRPSSDR